MSNRPQRVADLIKHALARLLLREAKDPRFSMVSITSVDVSPDLNNALIYVSVLDETKAHETVAALNKAAGYFRHALAEAVELRITPKLHFRYDESIVEADKINRLLEDALKKKAQD